MSIELDQELLEVSAELLNISDLERKVCEALRQALDEVIDGPRTGRHGVHQLEKTEKTYIGTKVEILLRHSLNLARGLKLDNLIAGHEVDTKFSLSASWMIPTEARDEICLLATVDELKSTASLGLLRMNSEVLTQGANRDGKCSVSAAGKSKIHWLFKQKAMQENFLLHLNPAVREKILSAKSGKKRIEALFTNVTNQLLPRTVILQVIQLPGDPLKRAREAKATLLPLGFKVLCANYENDRALMVAAGFEPKNSDDWLSLPIDS